MVQSNFIKTTLPYLTILSQIQVIDVIINHFLKIYLTRITNYIYIKSSQHIQMQNMFLLSTVNIYMTSCTTITSIMVLFL